MSDEKASYDDVSIYDLTPGREKELLTKQVECVFMGGNQQGYPIGVIIHEDQTTKDWFYPAMGELLNGYPATSVEAAVEMSKKAAH